jgi:hypothetical protein
MYVRCKVIASKLYITSYDLAAQILAFTLAFTHNIMVGLEIPDICREKFDHEVGLRIGDLICKMLSKDQIYIFRIRYLHSESSSPALASLQIHPITAPQQSALNNTTSCSNFYGDCFLKISLYIILCSKYFPPLLANFTKSTQYSLLTTGER